MATLDQGKISTIPVLLPPPEEQTRLIDQIDVISNQVNT
jgi:hypothetical protein